LNSGIYFFEEWNEIESLDLFHLVIEEDDISVPAPDLPNGLTHHFCGFNPIACVAEQAGKLFDP
jgi:hypothetical protein